MLSGRRRLGFHGGNGRRSCHEGRSRRQPRGILQFRDRRWGDERPRRNGIHFFTRNFPRALHGHVGGRRTPGRVSGRNGRLHGGFRASGFHGRRVRSHTHFRGAGCCFHWKFGLRCLWNLRRFVELLRGLPGAGSRQAQDCQQDHDTPECDSKYLHLCPHFRMTVPMGCTFSRVFSGETTTAVDCESSTESTTNCARYLYESVPTTRTT